MVLRLPGASAVCRIAVFIDILGALQEGVQDRRAISGRLPSAPSDHAGARAAMQRIDRVLNWIESQLARELRVEDAAAVAHVSTAAFARFFRREVGKSFIEYVNDARCGWAAL